MTAVRTFGLNSGDAPVRDKEGYLLELRLGRKINQPKNATTKAAQTTMSSGTPKNCIHQEYDNLV
jgi:hypothetical protein